MLLSCKLLNLSCRKLLASSFKLDSFESVLLASICRILLFPVVYCLRSVAEI